jgi:hypothetical protein
MVIELTCVGMLFDNVKLQREIRFLLLHFSDRTGARLFGRGDKNPGCDIR